MAVRVAINGFGRIGRLVLRAAYEHQPDDYRSAVLGTAPRVGVEAAVRFGWDRWLGPRSAFIGMSDFGASAPGEAVYQHFGITAEKVAEAARSLL